MSRSVSIHALLLAAALVAAYFVWTREPTTGDQKESFEILNLKSGLDKLVYDEPERKVVIERKKDDQGTYYWVRVETDEPAPPDQQPRPPASQPASQPAKPGATSQPASQPVAKKKEPLKPKMIRKIREFKGGTAAEELMKGAAKLSAQRALGKVDKKKLQDFGLADTKRKLDLIGGGTTRKLTIGKKTFGNMDSYVQDKSDSSVYVVAPRSIDDLLYAEYRLVDRALTTFSLEDVDRITVEKKGKKKVLEQHGRRNPADAFWSDSGSKKGKDLYRNWLQKLMRLRVVDYAKKADVPKDLEEVARVTFALGDAQKGAMTLYKKKGAAPPAPAPAPDPKVKHPAPPPPTTGGEYFAVSDNTRVHVTLSKTEVDEIARDVDNILK